MAELFKCGSKYDRSLRDLKERIRSAQVRAAISVNRELVMLYWGIGREILMRQQQQGWGAKVVAKLAKDLQTAFPEMKGVSRTNLLFIMAFAEAYPDEQIVQPPAGQFPRSHHCVLLNNLDGAKMFRSFGGIEPPQLPSYPPLPLSFALSRSTLENWMRLEIRDVRLHFRLRHHDSSSQCNRYSQNCRDRSH